MSLVLFYWEQTSLDVRTGSAAFTDTPDTFSASSYAVVQGRLSATEASDVFAAFGVAPGTRIGFLSATDATDTFAAIGTVIPTVAPPAPPPPPGPPTAGSGKAKGKAKSRPDYVQRTQEYWDERERYLRTLYPEEIEPAPPPDDLAENYTREANRLYEERKQQLEALTAERAAAISALRASPDLESMRRQGARITSLNAKIAELTGKQALSRFMH